MVDINNIEQPAEAAMVLNYTRAPFPGCGVVCNEKKIMTISIEEFF